ncbi:MAG: acetyl-CoA C-acetyltransferase [Polyangia bacterium]|nr:acetyl-CoA C-acetyltransferase [Polyangia bacterium]
MSHHLREVVIASAARTPVGTFGGTISAIPATQLGARAIQAAIERAGIDKEVVDECIMGCVLPAGQGQAPARQAAIYAGLPKKVECMTINKVCGSGLKAVMLATQAIQTGDAEIIVAGGMESMSMAPYYLKDARWGMRMNNKSVVDGMVTDGLWDPYDDKHMGMFAELCAEKFKYTREAQDAFAVESTRRAKAARDSGAFDDEIVPIEVPQKKGAPLVVKTDEGIDKSMPEKMPTLKPAFKKDGTVTAANASSINDGGAALVIMSREKADALGVKPIARILSQASFAQEPSWFTTAPIGSVKKALEKAKLQPKDIDLWEINEAFAVVTMATVDEFKLDPAKVNVNGGAVVLGHPIGCSGARVLTTLLYAMKKHGAKRGCATLCIGGGEGAALVVEAL